MDIPIPSQDGDIAVPLNSSYGQAAPSSHVIHHHDHHHNNHMIPSTTAAAAAATNTNNNNGGPHQLANVSTLDHDDHDPHPHAASSYKKVAVVVRYKECLKNHAAAMGGNAMDGCGEFMPSGEEGTIEALTCSACNCHRNFHRKEVDGDHQLSEWTPYGHSPQHLNRVGRKVIVGHHHKSMLPHEALVYPTGTLIASRAPTPHQMIMPYSMGSLPSESDEQEDAAGGGGGGGGGGLMVRPHHQMAKKRFRTKFTQEQKDKMLNFAEKVGWKIQRQEESVVQQFCQEIGVKRRVLKVWMHNNKHNLAKKNQTNNINPNINPSIN